MIASGPTIAGTSLPTMLDRSLEWLLFAYLLVLPISVAAGNSIGVLLMLAAWARPREAWRRLRERVPVFVLLAVLALPVVVAVYSIGADFEHDNAWDMLGKQRKVLLLSLAPIACQSAVAFVRVRFAVWAAGATMALATWLFFFTGRGLWGPFDPEVPVTVTHSYQNFMVGFAAVWLAYWLATDGSAASRWRRALAGIALIVMAGSILFVVTGRAGQLAFLVMAVLVLIGTLRRGRWLATAAVLTLAAGALMLSPQVRDRWTSIVDSWHGSTAEAALPATLRLSYLRNTVTIIEQAPWLGHGVGSFPNVYARVCTGRCDGLFRANHPHMDLLLYWAEEGLPGLLAMLSLYLAMWLAARGLAREPALMLRALTVGFAVGGLTHTFQLDYISGAFFYSIAGLLFAAPLSARIAPDGRRSSANALPPGRSSDR
ncbi:MAG: O-antigen ligase family protein [Burkholderiaceae bacterium]